MSNLVITTVNGRKVYTFANDSTAGDKGTDTTQAWMRAQFGVKSVGVSHFTDNVPSVKASTYHGKR